MAKYLKNIRVEFISLVRKGANNRTVIFKSTDADEPGEELRQVQAIKKDDAKQMIYGVVYAPDEVDAHGHQASAEEIELAAHGFMKALKAQNVDKGHSNKADGGAFVAESWIVRKGDPLFKQETPGAWAVGIKCEDPALYAEAQSELPAISMAGTATIVTKEDKGERIGGDAEEVGLLRKVLNLFIEKENNKQQEEQQMDEKQVQGLIDAAITKAAETPATGLSDMKAVIEKMTANMTALVERMEKIEKQSPGTQQDEQDNADMLKEQEELGRRIAKTVMPDKERS